MLPKDKRIPLKLWKEALLAPKRDSKYLHSAHFALKAVFLNEKQPRVAVSVSKKVAKSAVARNRIRRRAYTSVGKMVARLNPGLYILSAKVGAENLKGEKLDSETKSLFSPFLLK